MDHTCLKITNLNQVVCDNTPCDVTKGKSCGMGFSAALAWWEAEQAKELKEIVDMLQSDIRSQMN